MKRMWIGIGILLALLAMGIALTTAFNSLHLPLAHKLNAAAEAALAGDWDTAEQSTRQCREHWDSCRRLTASFADHEPLEEMDGLLAQLEIWLWLREPEEFAVTAAEISSLARAIAEAQSLTWWSLL